MSAIPRTYLAIVQPLIDTARGIMERGESLVPFAFVGNLTTRETYAVMLDTGSEAKKDLSAETIRQLAHSHQADFVFVIMDAWSLPPDKMGQVDEILERYGSIGASPYRVDVIAFSLETRHGIWVAQAAVQSKGHTKGARTFAAPTFQHFTEAQGRFVDLLPVKDDEGGASGTLH
jgi:hypothetical protein